jgi:hypothetical protein
MNPLRQKTAHWSRWLHIYASMFGLAALLFFSITGFVVNHESWFVGEPLVVEREFVLPESIRSGDRLSIVQSLQSDFAVRGELHSFDQDEGEWRLEFRGPGRLVELTIDPTSGATQLREERRGFAAVISDLHRGKGAGAAWKLMIDGAAVALAGVSLTGLIYWLAIPRRRAAAIGVLSIGVVLALLFYFVLVP